MEHIIKLNLFYISTHILQMLKFTKNSILSMLFL